MWGVAGYFTHGCRREEESQGKRRRRFRVAIEARSIVASLLPGLRLLIDRDDHAPKSVTLQGLIEDVNLVRIASEDIGDKRMLPNDFFLMPSKCEQQNICFNHCRIFQDVCLNCSHP